MKYDDFIILGNVTKDQFNHVNNFVNNEENKWVKFNYDNAKGFF